MPTFYRFEGESLLGQHQRVFIAIPTYGDIPAGFVHSLWAAQTGLNAARIVADLTILAGGVHVDDARNNLVREFLDSPCDQMVFLDADLQFDPVDLVRLIQHRVDVVAGIYPKKQTPEDYPVRFFHGEIKANSRGLVKVAGVPTGFLKIRREVLEQLASQSVKFKQTNDKEGQTMVPLIFERTVEDGSRFSGDYAFCNKWRKMGGEIHADLEMSFGHIGQNTWTGSIGHHLREVNGINRKTVLDGLKNIYSGKDVSETLPELSKAWGNPWGASVGFLALCLEIVRDTVKTKGSCGVLEAGSGLSTLVMASVPDTTVHSMEHDGKHHANTQKWLNDAGLFNAMLFLRGIVVNGFYRASSTMDAQYNVGVVDGPPRQLGDRMQFFHQLGNRCDTILVDDWEDNYSREVTSWAANNGFQVFEFDGFAVLRKG